MVLSRTFRDRDSHLTDMCQCILRSSCLKLLKLFCDIFTIDYRKEKSDNFALTQDYICDHNIVRLKCLNQ